MPIRAELLSRRWPLKDLPVLQFLAPQVFQPWPYQHQARRTYATPQPVRRDENIDGVLPESPSGRGYGNRDGNEQRARRTKFQRWRTDERPTLGEGPKMPKEGLLMTRRQAKLRVKEIRNAKESLFRTVKGRSDAVRFFVHLDQYRQISREPQRTYQRYGPHAQGQQSRTMTIGIPSKKYPGHVSMSAIRAFLVSPIKSHPEKGRNKFWDLAMELLESTSSSSVSAIWEKNSPQDIVWLKLMLLTMRDYPHKTLKIVAGTYMEPYPPSTMLADCLDFLIWHYLSGKTPSNDGICEHLYITIIGLLQHGPRNYVNLSANSVYLLMKHVSTPKHLVKLYRSLEEINHPFTADTLAHFASRLARSGPEYQDMAFEVLQRIVDLEERFNRPKYMSLCTTILKSSGDAKVNEKFEYMLRNGLEPNIIIYNVLLLKMLEAGDTAGGWRLYEKLKNHGPAPDKYTYSTLLNDAKLRRDTGDIETVLKAVRERGIRSPHIVVDALDAMLDLDAPTHPKKLRGTESVSSQPDSHRSELFENMLSLYSEYFRWDILSRILPGVASRYPQFASEKLEPGDTDSVRKDMPPIPVIIIMITAYLKYNTDPRVPTRFYKHWCKLLEFRDPVAVELARPQSGSWFGHIPNLILMALGPHTGSLPTCLKIIGDMSSSGKNLTATTQTANENGSSVISLRLPKPTSATWNILAKTFMDQRQPRAAEKVLTMMRERGMKPTNVTWDILISGYVRMQNMPMVIETVDRKEREGCQHDYKTFSILKEMEPRRAFFDGLQKKQMERLQDARLEQETPKTESISGDGVEQDVDEDVLVVGDMSRSYDPESALGDMTPKRGISVIHYSRRLSEEDTEEIDSTLEQR